MNQSCFEKPFHKDKSGNIADIGNQEANRNICVKNNNLLLLLSIDAIYCLSPSKFEFTKISLGKQLMVTFDGYKFILTQASVIFEMFIVCLVLFVSWSTEVFF